MNLRLIFPLKPPLSSGIFQQTSATTEAARQNRDLRRVVMTIACSARVDFFTSGNSTFCCPWPSYEGRYKTSLGGCKSKESGCGHMGSNSIEN